MIKSSIIIFIMGAIIVLLLINIYQQNKQIQSIQSTETMDNVVNIPNTPNIDGKDRIVLYYTNWCGHSRQFFPIWSAFEQRNGDKIMINKVDCENSKCDVPGFPTVKLYKASGEVINYDGPRTVEGLEDFINNTTHIKIKPTQNQNQSQNKNKIVLYYTNWCGFCKQFTPIWTAFEQMNKDKLIIDKVDCSNGDCDVAGFPTVKLYKPTGEVINFDGPRTVQGLDNFVTSNM